MKNIILKLSLLIISGYVALQSAQADAILQVTEIFEIESFGSNDSGTIEWYEIQNTGDTAYSNILFAIDLNEYDTAGPSSGEPIWTGFEFDQDDTIVIQPNEVLIVLNKTIDSFAAPTLVDNFQNFWFGNTNSGLNFAYSEFGPSFAESIESIYLYEDDADLKEEYLASASYNTNSTGAATSGTYTFSPGQSLLQPSQIGFNGNFQSVGVAGEAGSELQLIGSPGFVAMIPEPSAFALLTLSGIFLLRRRRNLKRGMTSQTS